MKGTAKTFTAALSLHLTQIMLLAPVSNPCAYLLYEIRTSGCSHMPSGPVLPMLTCSVFFSQADARLKDSVGPHTEM